MWSPRARRRRVARWSTSRTSSPSTRAARSRRSSKERPVSTKVARAEDYDELDQKIDGFLTRVGALLRVALILVAIGLFGYFILVPNWENWGQYILMGLYLIF